MRRKVSDPESLIPLMPAEFQVLMSLAEGKRHGYGIMEEIRTRNGHEMKIRPGTLYGTVKRLSSWNLITQVEGNGYQDADANRVYYAITDLGRTIASLEAHRLCKVVADAESKGLTQLTGQENVSTRVAATATGSDRRARKLQ